MKIIPLIQGTKEWLMFREKHVGASDSSSIMGCNPFKSIKQLWQEKTLGWEENINENMKRGQDLEPFARRAYQYLTGLLVEPVVAEHDTYSFLSASFDGITQDFKKAVEIKCGKKSHIQAKKGEIAPYYLCQIYHQMMIADLPEIHYFSYDGENNVLITVSRDNKLIEEMLEKEIAFWDCVVNFKQPEG